MLAAIRLRNALAVILAAALALAPALAEAASRATIYGGISAVYQGLQDLGAVEYQMSKDDDTSLTAGVGTNQYDILWSDTRTLTASATEDLDIRGTALIDAFGTSVAMVKVVAVLIIADSTNTNNVVVGNDAASVQLGFGAITHTWAIPPGGRFLVTAPASGWAVTATTADIIQVANSAGSTSVTYKIKVLGRSA